MERVGGVISEALRAETMDALTQGILGGTKKKLVMPTATSWVVLGRVGVWDDMLGLDKNETMARAGTCILRRRPIRMRLPTPGAAELLVRYLVLSEAGPMGSEKGFEIGGRLCSCSDILNSFPWSASLG